MDVKGRIGRIKLKALPSISVRFIGLYDVIDYLLNYSFMNFVTGKGNAKIDGVYLTLSILLQDKNVTEILCVLLLHTYLRH